MRNVFVKDTGVDNSANKYYGDVLAIAADSQFMIRVEQIVMPDVEYSFNYRITDDGYIQMIMIMEEEPLTIIAQFKLEGKSLNEMLKAAMREYLRGSYFYNGYPKYLDSVFLLEQEYDDLVQELRDEQEENSKNAITNKTKLIQHMEKHGLDPRPYGWDSSSWHARCTGSRFSHRLMISTKSDRWGCGYCDRKGYYDAFVKWLKELNRKDVIG